MLTLKQSEVLAFIQSFLAEHAYAPTTGEIAEAIGIRSRGVVYRYLKALQVSGYIDLVPNKRRNIQLKVLQHRLPLAGTIAAGLPALAVEDVAYLDMSRMLCAPQRFLLKVQGDSMLHAGIHDGDYAICEPCDQPRDGNIVVALIDDDHATLKYYQGNVDGSISLLPANDAFDVQTYTPERVRIQGRYVALVRLL